MLCKCIRCICKMQLCLSIIGKLMWLFWILQCLPSTGSIIKFCYIVFLAGLIYGAEIYWLWLWLHYHFYGRILREGQGGYVLGINIFRRKWAGNSKTWYAVVKSRQKHDGQLFFGINPRRFISIKKTSERVVGAIKETKGGCVCIVDALLFLWHSTFSPLHLHRIICQPFWGIVGKNLNNDIATQLEKKFCVKHSAIFGLLQASHMFLRQNVTIKSHDRGKRGYFGNHNVISCYLQLTRGAQPSGQLSLYLLNDINSLWSEFT